MSEQMVEAIVNGGKITITTQQLSEYQNNPNYKVICESGVYRILVKMEG